MNIKLVLSILSVILRFLSLVLLVPCVCAILDKDYFSVIPFVLSAILAFLIGYFMRDKNSNDDEINKVNRTEVFTIMITAWVSLCLFGAIPFLYYGLNPIDALFESVSGITTTGATILSDFSPYPKTMFFWRSFSQWLGGMGILVLFTVILPKFSIAGRQMFFTEVPGAKENNLKPRIRQTAAVLWGVYFTLTIIEALILYYLGMPIFDAICTSLSTVSGGGFSPKAQSLIEYGQLKYIWTVAIFMFVAGVNFALQYKVCIKGKIISLFKDEEFRLYSLIVIVFALMIAFTLTSHGIYDFSRSIRESFFEVLAVITTTGFASVDYSEWNLRAKLLLFILMFTGASIGSASGGIKLLRLMVILKYTKRQISKIHHPNGVYPIKINRTIISEDAIKQIISFVLFYYIIFAFTAVLLIFFEQNAITGLSSAIATIGNIGPGFGNIIGPMGNYSTLTIPSKFICIVNMLIGRLELIPFLAVFHPDFWIIRKK